MPILDMPLEELKAYRGINPRPDDFDAYWDAALAEMRAVDADIALQPAGFSAPGLECCDLYYTGVRGARIHARFVKPAHLDAPAPGLCVFHGYSGRAPEFVELIPYAYAGFVVAAMDCRGQGGESQDVGPAQLGTMYGHIVRGLNDPDPSRLLFRDIFLDAAQLAGILMARPDVNPARVCARGGSQGGGLSLACAALEPRIARLAPAFPFLSDYQRVWEMDLARDAYVGLRDFFRRFDPTHAREEQIFTRLGYIDVHHLAPRIRGHVLMGTGLMDNICPPSTQFAAYNAITAPKQMTLYPDFGHENLPGFEDCAFQFLLEA